MKVISSFIIAFFLMNSYASSQLEASLSSSEVVLGDSLTLTIKVIHEAADEPFVSFLPVNAEVINKRQSRSTRAFLQGGQLVEERATTNVYELQPVKGGYVHIRQIKADIDKKVLKHKSLRAKVVKEARKPKDFFMKAELSKDEVFVGEAVDVNYYLYSKRDTTMHVIKKFPLLKDFLKRFEIPRSQRERVNLGGELYYRQLMYKARAYPTKTGELKIDPITLEFKYADYRNRRRDIFGMSMQFSTGRYKERTLRSKIEKLKVLPLPVEGVPKNFTGLVGKHNFNLSISSEKVIVNDALEARLEVTGEGALEKFDPVRLFDDTYFESFDPKAEVSEINALETKKIIDYTYLAKKSGTIPQRVLKLSYFDPEKREYVETDITIPEISIFGSGTKSETIASNDVKQGNISAPKSLSDSEEEVEKLVGPFYREKEIKIFDLKIMNLILFLILVAIIFFPGFKRFIFSARKVKTLGPKDLNYKNLHDYLLYYFPEGENLRDRIDKSPLPPATKLYFKDLLTKAEKNEYKSEKNKLEYNKRHMKEVVKALNGSH